MKYREAKIADIEPKIYALLKQNWDSENKIFNKGLFFTGSTGVGKTYALHAIKNHVYGIKDRSTTDVENWVELLFELKEKLNSGYLREFVREHITSKSIVFLDDVGAEKQTEWSQEMLYLIVNRLYEQGKPLFIATNLSFEEFSQKYGDRLTSRLVEMCDMKELTGEDRRLK